MILRRLTVRCGLMLLNSGLLVQINRIIVAALLFGLAIMVSAYAIGPTYAQDSKPENQQSNSVSSSPIDSDHIEKTEKTAIDNPSIVSTNPLPIFPSIPVPTIPTSNSNLGLSPISTTSATTEKHNKKTSYHGWGLLKPVYNLQMEVGQLEQQIEKLRAPLLKLEPSEQSLVNQMSGIKSQTSTLFDKLSLAHQDVAGLQQRMEGIEGRLDRLREPVVKMAGPIVQLKDEVATLRSPVASLRQPIAELQGPVIALHRPISKLYEPLLAVDTELGSLGKRFSRLDEHFSDLDGRFSKLDNRFVDLHERFHDLDHRFSELDSRLAALAKQLGVLNTVLTTAVSAIIFVFAATTITILVGLLVVARKNSRYLITRFTPARNLSKFPD